MSNADSSHRPCAAKPMHALADRLGREAQAPLRVELPLIVRLTEEVMRAEPRPHPELLPQLHLAVCRLREAVTSHFDREEALLFPSVRLIEDGAGTWSLDLHRLVPELMREHVQIQDLLAKLRLMTHDLVTPGPLPMRRTLCTALAGVSRDLAAHFKIERDELYPRALAAQPPRRSAASEG